MAKSRCDLSAAVLKMLVVKLKLFLTHFRFTDNQHHQGQGGWVGNWPCKGPEVGRFLEESGGSIQPRPDARNSAYIEVG